MIIGRVARPGFLIFFSRAGDLFSNLVHSPFEKRLFVFRASSKQRFGQADVIILFAYLGSVPGRLSFFFDFHHYVFVANPFDGAADRFRGDVAAFSRGVDFCDGEASMTPGIFQQGKLWDC